jgi:gluconolactonase
LKTQELKEPVFAIYDDAFLEILGPEASIELAIQKDWPFAHEAPTYIPDQDAVFITSNRFKAADSDEATIKISKLSRKSDGTWESEVIEGKDFLMGNGGINYAGGVLFCAQGNLTEPGGIVLMEARPPYQTKTLIDSYHGRLFNSVNDLVLQKDGSIWFTDPIYGYEQGFRGKPQLPCQVYRFDPETGDIRVVADGFGRPNGLCFSPDEKTMYITDTDWIHGDGTIDPMRVGTM